MKEGDCYEANALAILDILSEFEGKRKVLKNYKLCHGKVIGAKGSTVDGEVFSHCWIEINGDVIMDYSNGKTIVGRIERIKHRIVGEPKRYTPMQVAKNLLKFEHYGPWEDKDDKNNN